MGGCATKLKVLMAADGGETAAPLPKEEASEGKEVAVVDDLKKVDRDIVVDAGQEIVDEEKRQSLSTLFKEIENKDSTTNDNTPSEAIKHGETSLAETLVDKSEKKPLESGQADTQVEQKPREAFEVPIQSNEAEKALKVAPAATVASDKKTEESLAEKAIGVAPATVTTDKKTAESAEVAETAKPEKKAVTETKASETPVEKKVVEVKSASVNPKPETPKAVEQLDTSAQNPSKPEEKAVEQLATSVQTLAKPEEKKAVETETAKEPDVKKVIEVVAPKPETPKEEQKLEKPATTVAKDGK